MSDIRPIKDDRRPKVYIETYGCQMNVNDSEVILSILQDSGYALTEDNDLLLIAIDGRWPGKAEGMNAAEVTRFIVRYFNPQWAINMDGGGSTTLTIKGLGHPETNVVNYPTDGGTHDHTGERKVTTHLLVLCNEDAQ